MKFKDYLIKEGLWDTISNKLIGHKNYTDAEIILVARKFFRYLSSKIKWNSSNKDAGRQLLDVVKGMVLGHDDQNQNPKTLNLGTIADSIVMLTHGLNQVNKKQLMPEDIARFYLHANQDNPKDFPLQPGSSNPSVLLHDRINKEFSRTKPDINAYATKENEDKLKNIVSDFKKNSFPNATKMDEDLIFKLLDALKSSGPWPSILEKLYLSYRKLSTAPTTAVDFVNHLIINHWKDIPKYTDLQSYAEKIDAKTSTTPPPSPPPPPPGPGSKDAQLVTFFSKWCNPTTTPPSPVNLWTLVHLNHPRTDRSLFVGKPITLSDWKAASNVDRQEVVHALRTGFPKTNAARELVALM